MVWLLHYSLFLQDADFETEGNQPTKKKKKKTTTKLSKTLKIPKSKPVRERLNSSLDKSASSDEFSLTPQQTGSPRPASSAPQTRTSKTAPGPRRSAPESPSPPFDSGEEFC